VRAPKDISGRQADALGVCLRGPAGRQGEPQAPGPLAWPERVASGSQQEAAEDHARPPCVARGAGLYSMANAEAASQIPVTQSLPGCVLLVLQKKSAAAAWLSTRESGGRGVIPLRGQFQGGARTAASSQAA